AGGLALGSYQGWITEHLIFALIFVVGAARAFQMPAMAALLPLLVPRRLFPRALATNSAATQAAIIVGPALGGFVYIAGPAAVYATSVALFLVTGVTIYLVRLVHAQGRFEEVGLDSVFAGISLYTQPSDGAWGDLVCYFCRSDRRRVGTVSC